jgi:hypothetical protein
MNTTTEQVKAMESVREIIQSVNFSVENIVVYSPEYVSWTANKVCSVSVTTSLDRRITKNFCEHAILTSLFLTDSFNSSTD